MNAPELRLPPHSIQSEQAVLGALMIGGAAAWDRVADVVVDADFYRDDHRRIFGHIRALAENGKAVDVVTVSEAIERGNEVDQTGGLAYLAEIANGAISAANIKHYAETVANDSLRRRLVIAAGQIDAIAYGRGEAREAIDQAQLLLAEVADVGPSRSEPIAIGAVMGSVINAIEDRLYAGSLMAGIPTGFSDLDRKLFGLRPGNLIVVAGRPSMGKTALALNIGEYIAVVDRKPALVFSAEMSKEELGHRSLSSVGGVSIDRLTGGGELSDDDWDRMTAAMGKLHEAPLVIDDSAGLTISQMAARARRMKRRQGLSLIVIDYLQLMTGESGGRGDNRNLELGDITRRMKQMAKELHVPVIVLSQLSRKVEDRPNKRPMMSDLRDSGAIEQDADVVLMVYRDEYYHPDSLEAGTAEVQIVKHRMGATGLVQLAFQGEFCRFRNLDQGEKVRISQAREEARRAKEAARSAGKPRRLGAHD